MHVAVLVEAYPSIDNPAPLRFVHSRNIEYLRMGIQTEVVNFSSTESYSYEGISVVGRRELSSIDASVYDVVLLHAPNIKHHMAFLKRHRNTLQNVALFAHGHEFLRVSDYYPVPYSFVRQNGVPDVIQRLYDFMKLTFWKRWFIDNKGCFEFVSVSEWMEREAFKCLGLDPHEYDGHLHVIPNNVGDLFEKESFAAFSEKQYDFLTIRANLDNSKYAVDVVIRLARENPDHSFLLVGKGKLPLVEKLPENMVWEATALSQAEIIDYTRIARCALMPTRLDAQGVLACELASIGMPLITSDIPICHDVFCGFSNVAYIDNEAPCNLGALLNDFERKLPFEKNRRFYKANTVDAEISLLTRICGGHSFEE